MNRHAAQLISRGAINKLAMLMIMGIVSGWPLDGDYRKTVLGDLSDF